MPEAEDIRLQSQYERAVRTGDQSSARALLDQIQARAANQQTQRITPAMIKATLRNG
jgi:hypothetical protein